MRTMLMITVALIAAQPLRAATTEIAPDRMAVVNGQRTFVLGLYENPKEDTVLEQARAAGFNLIHATPDTAALDRLKAHDLFAWINTGAAIDLSEDTEKRAAGLAEMAEKFAQHPALMVWEVPDEALWNNWHLANEWRTGMEPKQLRELIAGLTADPAAVEKLQKDLARTHELRGQARYAESEALADSIWTALGKTQPHPEWSTSTAQARSEVMAEGMMRGYKRLRELDPAHPVWMNHAPRNSLEQLAMFSAAADIAGCDIYPVPRSPLVGHSDIMDQNMSSVGGYTIRMQDSAPGKPVWMVLQGFGWADIQEGRTPEEAKILRRPTKAETRFMAYDAIVCGARGVLYWGTMAVEKDSVFWKELLEVVAELSSLQPVLSAPDALPGLKVALTPTRGSMDRGVRVLAKDAPDGVWLVVVNEWYDPLEYTVSGLGALNNIKYADPDAGVETVVDGGALTLRIPAQTVQVLRPVK